MMTLFKKTLTTLSLSAAVVACGGNGTTRTVTGTLALGALGRTGAVAVAVAEDGTRTEALVGPNGHFELSVPHGRRHAIGFRDADQPRYFANLVNGPERRSMFEVEAGDDNIDIGGVRPAEPGDDNGGDRPESADDDHDACRGLEAEQPSISTVPMFLVVGEVPLDAPPAAAPVSDDSPLHDADDDHRPDGMDDDHDGDGLCDDDDDDGDESDGGVDGGVDDHADSAELPYAVRLEVGDRFRLTDAFLEKGPAPAAILSVEMDGSTWRLAELRADQEFEVTQADCDHQGNRDRGRDRAFIAWRNADGTQEVDHLDLRYCD